MEGKGIDEYADQTKKHTAFGNHILKMNAYNGYF